MIILEHPKLLSAHSRAQYPISEADRCRTGMAQHFNIAETSENTIQKSSQTAI